MQAIPLKASEREILGKKVRFLRRQGLVPGHVFGKNLDSEHVSVKMVDFLKVLKEAGETGLVELKIGDEKTRPVLIRQVQVNPITSVPIHIDFYQVNLKEKTTVAVPIIQIGEEPELVHTGEAVVIQPLMEVEVEALPVDLPENIEVDITSLKAIDDAILVSALKVPETVTILAEPDAVVVKLETAVTAEMQALLEEQAAEQVAATEAAAEEGEAGEKAEGEEGAEGAEGETDESVSAEATADKGAGDNKTEDKPSE
jgi:large subunit ribosomal protein L25